MNTSVTSEDTILFGINFGRDYAYIIILMVFSQHRRTIVLTFFFPTILLKTSASKSANTLLNLAFSPFLKPKCKSLGMYARETSSRVAIK